MLKPYHLWKFPTFELNNGWREWWVDPLIATLSFAVSIHIYWYHEHKYNHCCTPYPKWNSSLFQWKDSDIYKSGIAYWIGILLFKTIIYPPGQTFQSSYKPIPDGIPDSIWSFFRLGLEVITGILFYDFLFFFIHWSISNIRYIHVRHHQHSQISSIHTQKSTISMTHRDTISIQAKDVLRHSLPDGILQVIVNIIVQRYNLWGYCYMWIPFHLPYTIKSQCARWIHNILITWMLTESHTSYPHFNVFRHYCIGIREHRLHHMYPWKYDTRYQPFFGYLDQCRFQWKTKMSKCH